MGEKFRYYCENIYDSFGWAGIAYYKQKIDDNDKDVGCSRQIEYQEWVEAVSTK